MKKENVTLDDLAMMVQKGFDHVDKRFAAIDKRFDEVDNRFEKIEKKLDLLERGQEDIKLRQDNCVYRFELKELDRRVGILERRLKAA